MKGNPVMRAKRTTGPTPNTVLCQRVSSERCQCGKPATRTQTVPGVGSIVRHCIDCIGSTPTKPTVRPEIVAEMWWRVALPE